MEQPTKQYVKDIKFEGIFEQGDLVREVDTDRVFPYDHKETRACNFNSTFERVFEVDVPPVANK